jgi:two-component system chemotaxis response regulator CheY
MRALIVESDLISREILQRVLENYGKCDLAVNGREAVEAVEQALNASRPYELICMDMIISELSGLDALRRIRRIEKEHGLSCRDEAKVIVVTELNDPTDVIKALYEGGASAYFVKPIEVKVLCQEIEKLGLIKN